MEEGEEGEAVGVVFDCDGTLADSLPPHIAFLHAMNVELGAGLTLPAERDRRGCRELAAAPMDNFLRSAGFTEADVARCVQRYEASFAEEHPVFLFDGVPALLRRLSEGGAKLAIVSSNTSRNVRACLENGVGSGAVRGGGGDAAQHLPKFDFIWGIDNASRSKAESLGAAALELGLPPSRVVYIGDTTKDALAAQAAGVHFVGADWGGFEDMAQVAAEARGHEEVQRRIEAPSIYDAEEGEPPPDASPCTTPTAAGAAAIADGPGGVGWAAAADATADSKWGSPWGPKVSLRAFEVASTPEAAYAVVERLLRGGD